MLMLNWFSSACIVLAMHEGSLVCEYYDLYGLASYQISLGSSCRRPSSGDAVVRKQALLLVLLLLLRDHHVPVLAGLLRLLLALLVLDVLALGRDDRLAAGRLLHLSELKHRNRWPEVWIIELRLS